MVDYPSDVIGFFLHTLSFIVSPSLLEHACTHGIKETGIKDVEAILSAILRRSKRDESEGRPTSAAAGTKETKRKARDEEEDEGRSKKARLETVSAPELLSLVPRGPELNSKQICSRIMNSQNLPDMMGHVRDNRQGFNYICASAAVSKAVKMNKRSQSDVNDFLELVEIARGYLPEMEARNLSSLIYSLAKSGQYNEGLIREILTHAGKKLVDFEPQNLANTIWALANLSYKDGSVFIKKLLKGASPKLKDFNPQALANTLWALATLNYSTGSAFVKKLLKEAEPKLIEFNPQELANTMWALATLNYVGGSSFVKRLLKEAEPKLRVFDPQNLSNTIWALASMKESSGLPFIDQLLREAEPKLRDFKPQELANTVWALATLNYSDGSSFIEQMLKEAESKLHYFKPQNLANTAWSLAVLDHSNAPSFLTRFLPLAYGLADKMVNENRRQCLQYLLLMEDGGHVTAEIKSDPRYLKFRRMCQDLESVERTSKIQLEIFEAVCCHPGCSDATSEHLTEDGLFSIDIALQLSGGQKLAIEVDGPTHFLTDGTTLNGNTVLRNRLLENRGWKVISIPVIQWRSFQGLDEKRAYLLSLLEAYTSVKNTRKRERSAVSDAPEPASPPKKKKKKSPESSAEVEEPVITTKKKKKAGKLPMSQAKLKKSSKSGQS